MPVSKQQSIDAFIKGVNEELSGVMAIALVDIESGMTLGKLSNVSSLNPEVASAYNVDVVKAKLKAIEALGIEQKIDDILITLSDQYHLIKVSPKVKYMSYLAIKKGNTNLGIVRATINQYFSKLTI